MQTTTASALEDPLNQAQRFIDCRGTTGEGKALLAVVKALWKGTGQFDEKDLYSLSSDSLALVAALVEARANGRYPEWKWHRASCYPSWRFLLDLHKQYGIT
jgi:hypothetical protein